MRPRPKRVAIAVGLAMAAGVLCAPNTLRSQDGGDEAGHIVAINAAVAQCGPDEPLQCVLAMGYTGDEKLFVDEAWVVRLLDERGAMLPPVGPSLEPGPTPPDHFVHGADGRRQHVAPVRALLPGDATATILADALAIYRPLRPGKYVMYVEAHRDVHDPERIIDRSDEDVSSDLWAPVDAVTDRVRTVSNSLQIEVRQLRRE